MSDEDEAAPVWQTVWNRVGSDGGGEEYSRLITSLRGFLAAFAGAGVDSRSADALTLTLDDWTSRLLHLAVDERDQIYAQRPGLDGRGQVTSPAIIFTELGHSIISGRVTFDRYFLGSNGAAHGGAVAFMFDEAAGRLAHLSGRGTARTAYLHTTYRSITPIDVELEVSGRIVLEEGRKRLLRLELRRGGTVCAEAEVLMVALRSGQA